MVLPEKRWRSVYPNAFKPTGWQFVLALVFPYLLVVMMAYVGARVVYALGKEVSRARELGSYSLIDRIGHGGMGEVWRVACWLVLLRSS